MFSGVPNGPLRLSPPQVHAAVHNSGTTVYDRMSYCAIEGTRDTSPLAKQIASLTRIEYPKVLGPPLISESDWHLRRGDEVEEIVTAAAAEAAAAK